MVLLGTFVLISKLRILLSYLVFNCVDHSFVLVHIVYDSKDILTISDSKDTPAIINHVCIFLGIFVKSLDFRD